MRAVKLFLCVSSVVFRQRITQGSRSACFLLLAAKISMNEDELHARHVCPFHYFQQLNRKIFHLKHHFAPELHINFLFHLVWHTHTIAVKRNRFVVLTPFPSECDELLALHRNNYNFIGACSRSFSQCLLACFYLSTYFCAFNFSFWCFKVFGLLVDVMVQRKSDDANA